MRNLRLSAARFFAHTTSLLDNTEDYPRVTFVQLVFLSSWDNLRKICFSTERPRLKLVSGRFLSKSAVFGVKVFRAVRGGSKKCATQGFTNHPPSCKCPLQWFYRGFITLDVREHFFGACKVKICTQAVRVVFCFFCQMTKASCFLNRKNAYEKALNKACVRINLFNVWPATGFQSCSERNFSQGIF